MLVELSVRNLALIDALTVEFRDGFSVLTGETGAGKSMLVDALSLVLGARARPEILRSGTEEAEVSAVFRVDPAGEVARKVREHGVACDEEVILRRVVQAGGGRDARSRGYINGRAVTRAELFEQGQALCNISSQHESVSLTDPATHLLHLDAFGGLVAERSALSSLVEEALSVEREYREHKEREKLRLEREDYLRYQHHELEELSPTLGEEKALEDERGKLREGTRLLEVTQGAADRLSEGEGAISDVLFRIVGDLRALSVHDPSLARVTSALEGAHAEVCEAGRTLSRYAETCDITPERLEVVEERLFRLQKWLRMHGPTTRELLQHKEELEAELRLLSSGEEREKELLSRLSELRQDLKGRAEALSAKRRAISEGLSAAMSRELSLLGMGAARILVEVTQASQSSEGLLLDGVRILRTGLDRVEFLIAPNRGEDPKPLRRIASGGELSRALLALKCVLAESGPQGLYVFDEVDSGVGGGVAEVIGRKVRELAAFRQVLCVTHLPQIAALADHHYVVGKSESKGRTFTEVRLLSKAERVEEVARMMGGLRISDATRRAAKDLMAER